MNIGPAERFGPLGTWLQSWRLIVSIISSVQPQQKRLTLVTVDPPKRES